MNIPKADARIVLAVYVCVGFTIITAQQLYAQGPGMEILMGTWAAGFGAAINYFFGSTRGSDMKTKMLAKAGAIDVADSDSK